jgi:RNA polymerase sigma factor (sigma-70 family)
LVIRVQRGDWDAYTEIVYRFQDMAVGYSYSLLGDLDLAQDAAQEAFLNALHDLPALRAPAAFPAWFRQIVFKHIDRARRGQRLPLVALDAVTELASHQPGPAELTERRAFQEEVRQAIQSLPEPQRAVVTLFYINQHSQEEIAAFLGIPSATVKTRLFAARKRLKERMLSMIEKQLPAQRPSRDDAFTQKVMHLFAATIAGDLPQVSGLLDQEPGLSTASGKLDSPLWRAETPALHVAVMYGRKEIIDLLLARGADINEKDSKFGFTALHQAIDLEFLPDYAALNMVDFLLARGARKDIFALLWLADEPGVRALLAADPAQANAIGPNLASPLCHTTDTTLLQLLLDHGADLWQPLAAGWGASTTLRWVTQHNRKSPQKLRFLLERAGIAADIFLDCLFGEPDNVTARLAADPELLRATTGADHVLEPGLTPLHIAAQFGHVDLARLLLERGAQVNAVSPLSHHLTPLHVAVFCGQIAQNPTQPLAEMAGYNVFRLLPGIPELLLAHGADLSARDSLEQRTPLEMLEAEHEDETDRSEVIALLRRQPAPE